ncbi:MAG: cupin domain-containing protein [Candidatus Geothermincolia bacterium]
MAYVDASRIPESRVPAPFERALKVVMDPATQDDVDSFTLIFSALAPEGGATDFHAHESSGELMVFTRGEGRAWLAGVEYELKPGVAIYAPPGVEHRTLNTGTVPLEIVCVFIPPAPEDYIQEMISAAIL